MNYSLWYPDSLDFPHGVDIHREDETIAPFVTPCSYVMFYFAPRKTRADELLSLSRYFLIVFLLTGSKHIEKMDHNSFPNTL